MASLQSKLISSLRGVYRRGKPVVRSVQATALVLDGKHDDILSFLDVSKRPEAAMQIAGAKAKDRQAALNLSNLVLERAQRSGSTMKTLLSALELAERHEVLDSGPLFLNLGHSFVERGDIPNAMRAYVQATPKHSDNKWHVGQKLHDYINDKKPDGQTLQLMIEAIEGAKDLYVPDLYCTIIRRACEIPDFDLTLVHGMSRAVGWGIVSAIGNKALEDGKHALALRAYDCATIAAPDEISLRLQIGITQFLAGHYPEAEKEWALTEYMRTAARRRWGLEDRPIRFLGRSWFAAIGHVAYIDTYIKSMELGWRPKVPTAYLLDQERPPPGAALLPRWSDYIQVYSTTGSNTELARKLVGYKSEPVDEERFHLQRVESLTDEFWSAADGNGRIRWYAPYGAEVERAWKAAGKGPLLKLSEEEHARTRSLLEQVFGLPHDAWFVALHVRETGFHASWHKAHPGTRHADISTYDKVIDFVTRAGGWVVRVGDRSMTSIAPRRQVIDYATSPYRNFDLDVYLCGACAYFIGTNSGLSLVPPLFGRRCVLTNWSPIAIPNWYLDDIYIPKLVRNLKEKRYLTFKEMYGSAAGWTQWQRDYPEGQQLLEDNSRDDLLDAVEEIHAEVLGGRRPTTEELALVDRFNAIAVAGNSYVGSRIGVRFAKKYKHLLD